MSPADTAELKRNLRTAGFEIYRATPQLVHLAERVRDNLIMDSGVAGRLQKQDGLALLGIQVTVRAQASHFPGADEKQVWGEAQALAKFFTDSGYIEEDSNAEPVVDPSDPNKSLDTSYEIRLARTVGSIESLHTELRAALARQRSTNDD